MTKDKEIVVEVGQWMNKVVVDQEGTRLHFDARDLEEIVEVFRGIAEDVERRRSRSGGLKEAVWSRRRRRSGGCYE